MCDSIIFNNTCLDSKTNGFSCVKQSITSWTSKWGLWPLNATPITGSLVDWYCNMEVQNRFVIFYQWRHVPSVHLSAGDVLLGLGHGAHLEALWTSGSWPHNGWESHRACLHLTHLVELLLQHCGPQVLFNRKRRLLPSCRNLTRELSCGHPKYSLLV